MILNQFPDLKWLKSQANAGFNNRQGIGGITLQNQGWPTIILNTKTKEVVRDNIQGPLSIFTNLSGRSSVTVNKRRVTLTSDTFFISNSGQSYTLEVHEASSTETFNIHFGEHFAAGAIKSIFSTSEDLLDQDSVKASEDFGFHNRLVLASPEFHSIVESIRTNGTDKLFLEEKLFQLLILLVREQKKVGVMHKKISAIKSSTKDEILKRLLVVTDYLYTFNDRNPDLEELARIGCMSKFHFLRLFKVAYGQTPHQFITTLRIKRAQELLKKTSGDIKVIAEILGFESSSAFSRTFRNHTGVYPTQFRGSC